MDDHSTTRGKESETKKQSMSIKLLKLDPNYTGRATTRRWVYVFVIDRKGEGQLLFLPLRAGMKAATYPDPKKDESAEAAEIPRSGYWISRMI
jgi:hypothetical protein